MDPRYFHHELTIHEANDYMIGLSYRSRAGWEQTRLSCDVAARCAGNQDGIQLTFPWEKEEESEEEEIEWIAGMEERARETAALFKNNKTNVDQQL